MKLQALAYVVAECEQGCESRTPPPLATRPIESRQEKVESRAFVPRRSSRDKESRTTHFLLATRSTFYSLLSWLTTFLAHFSLGCLGCLPDAHDSYAPKSICFGQKALNRGTHPQTSPGAFHPVKTWIFAILSSVEFLAKMAYGSGMKNQAIRVPRSLLGVSNLGIVAKDD